MTKLEKMLKYVSEHNDFYKNRIKEYGIKDPLDITQWPVLTRKELQENRYNMFSDGYESKYYNQQLRRQSSSGSTGMPINVYWDYKDWYASNMSLWRKRQQWYGISPQDKCVIFTLNAFNTDNDGKTIYYVTNPPNILSINVSLINNDNSYLELIDIINRHGPKWMYIQPFTLNKLIKAYKKSGQTPPNTLKYVETVGELLGSDTRNETEKTFKIPIANMYGSEEMNCIAFEAPSNKMVVLSDNVYVEVKQTCHISKLGCGEAIITNLNNYCQPLIRYCQGDSIIVGNENGNANKKVIEVIKGRTLNSIVVDNTYELNPLMLLEIMAEINNVFPEIIKDYKFTYNESKKNLVCHLSLNPSKHGWTDVVKLAILQKYKQKCIFSDKCSMNIVVAELSQQHSVKKTILSIEKG